MKTPTAAALSWYVRRAARMSPAEVVWRAIDHARRILWRGRQVRPGLMAPDVLSSGQARFAAALPPAAADRVPVSAKTAILTAADQLMAGTWTSLGVVRTDMAEPDWFRDPLTGIRAPAESYAFTINTRSPDVTGDIKQVWEISRLQHLTLLATAWFVSHDDRYARRVADQLRSWWQANPFLSGVNWTSGIEVGIRLISMTWIRRLLDDWPGVTDLFDRSDLARRQIRWHQEYLASFRSRGSSANNHVIAEAAGQLVASCALSWYPESEKWRRNAARLLELELGRNTFPSGINRELASGYHYFVAELALLAAVESEIAGCPLSPQTWERLCAILDSGAALLDQGLHPPRQGDDDEGRAVLLNDPAMDHCVSVLAMGAEIFGAAAWWPQIPSDAESALVGELFDGKRREFDRPEHRPWHFADAGITLLRTSGPRDPEIWCRCDGGPHGYLSIAAHAHADALAVEVRCDGVEVLADPGTYCYHGEPEWRSYFRSTLGHNTIEIDGENQSTPGGPFLWVRHARTRELDVQDIGDAVEWTAEHDGYSSGRLRIVHQRCVRLDRASRTIDIVDEIRSDDDHELRMAFHLGPDVDVETDGPVAMLRWTGAEMPGSARLELPPLLDWKIYKGATNPILGWYSAGLGRRTPAATLVGHGRAISGAPLITRLEFHDVRHMLNHAMAGRASASWPPSDRQDVR